LVSSRPRSSGAGPDFDECLERRMLLSIVDLKRPLSVLGDGSAMGVGGFAADAAAAAAGGWRAFEDDAADGIAYTSRLGPATGIREPEGEAARAAAMTAERSTRREG
jgi:hypothetical protein